MQIRVPQSTLGTGRAHKDFYDLEAWGGPAKALSHVNVGEAVHVRGDIRQTQPVVNEDGSRFYPKDKLRVHTVDFIGANRAAQAARSAGASVEQMAPAAEVGRGVDDDFGVG